MKFTVLLLLLFPFLLLAQHHRVAPSFSQLKFIENKGQWDKSIDFKCSVPGGTAFFSERSIAYTFEQQEDNNTLNPHYRPPVINRHNLIIDFVKAQKATISGHSKWSGKWNYLRGNDHSKWKTGIESFQQITYDQLYEGISMEVLQKRDHLKFQFIVSPQADPQEIGMQYKGAQKIELAHDQLYVRTSVNALIEKKPFAYQIINGTQVQIPCAFKLQRTTVSFELGYYDESLPLIIDPDLIFSTYSGSPTDNWGNTTCPDKYGNTIVGGTIFFESTSNQFPTTSGAFQTDFQGRDTDILIFKLDSTGQNLMFATYFGGNNSEIPTSFVVDEQTNELIILATTSSSDYPMVSSSYDANFKGGPSLTDFLNCSVEPLVGAYDFSNGTDLVISRLNEDGSVLKGSTYLGGTDNDGIIYQLDPLTNNYGDQLRGDVILDNEGNICIASNTHSSDFTPQNGFQSTYGGGTTDGLVAKFSPNLSTLIFSSFLGGGSDDACFSIKADSNNDLYIAGGSKSTNFPTTTNAFDPINNGDVDAFVTHISADGTSIIESTFAGTPDFDQAYFMDIGPDEHIYLFGQTKGEYPVTANKHHNTNAGQFIHKLNKNLQSEIWSTVIGSNNSTVLPNISPTAFLVNDCGLILLSGWGGHVNRTTTSVIPCNGIGQIYASGYNGGTTNDMEITPGAYREDTDGNDFYLAVLEQEATELLYATFFGSYSNSTRDADHVDGGTSRFDKTGIVYQSVCAGCGGRNNFPLFPSNNNTSDYPKENQSNNCNNGIFKFSLSNLSAAISTEDCQGLNLSFYNNTVGGSNYLWEMGDGTIYQKTDKETFVHTYKDYGEYTVKLKVEDEISCLKEDSTELEVKVSPKIVPQYYNDSLCMGEQKQLIINQFDNDSIYDWNPKTNLDNYQIYNPIFTADSTITYAITVTDTIGCERQDTFDIYIPTLDIQAKEEIIGNCIGETPKVTFTNNSEGIKKYFWDFGDGTTSTEAQPTHQFREYGIQEVLFTGTTDQCSDSTSITFTLYQVDVPNIITPNGDGKNDDFHPSGLENSGEWRLVVYNRWGDPIYQSDNYLNEWGAIEQEDGTYYYLLTAPDDSFCKGWVQVIR